jgi:acetylglutamate kinase
MSKKMAVNKDIVMNLQILGFNAVGISGKDGNILKAQKKLVEGQDAGLIGEVAEVSPRLINVLIENDFIPVIAPTGMDENGNTLNINADYAASAIAGALKAEKFVFLTDISGVMRDINDSNSIISDMTVSEAQKLIKDGVISGGIIPKVDCCIESVKKGIKAVHILDSRVEHSLLEIFADTCKGTMINRDY